MDSPRTPYAAFTDHMVDPNYEPAIDEYADTVQASIQSWQNEMKQAVQASIQSWQERQIEKEQRECAQRIGIISALVDAKEHPRCNVNVAHALGAFLAHVWHGENMTIDENLIVHREIEKVYRSYGLYEHRDEINKIITDYMH